MSRKTRLGDHPAEHEGSKRCHTCGETIRGVASSLATI